MPTITTTTLVSRISDARHVHGGEDVARCLPAPGVVDEEGDDLDDDRRQHRAEEALQQPSDMNGTRMNQLVAPTSFITDTSRRRAKMAMRMVLRMSTAAETIRTMATARQTHFEMLMTVSSLWIVCCGSVTVSTPAVPVEGADHLGRVGQCNGGAPVGGRHLGLGRGLEDVGGQQLAGLGEVAGLVPVLRRAAARS